MGGLSGTARFRTLAAETTQALRDRGLDVVPAVVNDVLLSGAQQLAEQLGVTPRTALAYADPDRLAAQIAAVAEQGLHGVRPVRDGGTVAIPSWMTGKVVAGLGQAVGYAVANGDTHTADHAADLLTEFGIALLASRGAASSTVETGCLIEAADLLDKVAGQLAAGQWRHCPCETEHGQADLDGKVALAMRDDAAFARTLADRPADDRDAAD